MMLSFSAGALPAEDEEDAIGYFLSRLEAEDLRLRFGGGRPPREPAALRHRLGLSDPRSTVLLSLDAAGAVAGMASLALASANMAETAVIVRSDLKHRGVGTALMRCLVRQARMSGLTRLMALVLYENFPARRLVRRLGFRQIGPLDMDLQFQLDLEKPPAGSHAPEPIS
jgi:acetyltransferase